MVLSYGWGSIASKLQSHYEEAAYFLPISSQIFLVLIRLILEGWKAESILEPTSGFEHGTPELGILHLINRPLIHFYTLDLISLRLRSKKNLLIIKKLFHIRILILRLFILTVLHCSKLAYLLKKRIKKHARPFLSLNVKIMWLCNLLDSVSFNRYLISCTSGGWRCSSISLKKSLTSAIWLWYGSTNKPQIMRLQRDSNPQPLSL